MVSAPQPLPPKECWLDTVLTESPILAPCAQPSTPTSPTSDACQLTGEHRQPYLAGLDSVVRPPALTCFSVPLVPGSLPSP